LPTGNLRRKRRLLINNNDESDTETYTLYWSYFAMPGVCSCFICWYVTNTYSLTMPVRIIISLSGKRS
jgi:hypothetical protein